MIRRCRIFSGLSRRVLGGILWTASLTGLGTATATQDQSAVGPKQPLKAASQLVEENRYYQVSRLDLPAGSDTQVHQNKRDCVIVVTGEVPVTLVLPKSSEGQQVTNGEARFFPCDADPNIRNSSDRDSQALVIELKQHWDADVRTCAEPMKCSRPIRMGSTEIGETTSLFTNGFITAYRHRVVVRGTLTSSYFSSKGKDHLLFIPLTDLRANFDGTEENLKRSQAYASDATEVEVNADLVEARWIVIRVETPK
jgi:hypothetical protein